MNTASTAASRRVVHAVVAGAALVSLLLLGVAAWVAYDTATYVPRPREDVSLHGVAYVVAVVLAVPGVLGLFLAGLAGWHARRGNVGLGFGLCVTALLVLLPFAVYAVSAFVL